MFIRNENGLKKGTRNVYTNILYATSATQRQMDNWSWDRLGV